MRWERVLVNAKIRETGEGKKSVGRKGGVFGPGRRWGHTCNAVKGGRFLYVFGGYGEDNCQTNDVHVFDTAKQTWSKPMMKGTPPSPRDSHTCTTVGNKLFVFGGTDGKNPLKDLYVLDTSSNTWMLPSVCGKRPDAREGHSAALVGTRLFIFGGCGKSESNFEEVYYDDLFILDTENFVWERASAAGTPPSARDSHTCASWRNKLIVLGGEDASDYYLSDVFVLDTDSMVWKELSTSGQMLAPRAGHCAMALGKNLFVFGGFTDHRNLYDDLHVLNMDNGIWNRVTNVNEGPSARFSAAGDCVDARSGILVLIGGCNGSLEALDDMYYLYTDILVGNEDLPDRKDEKLSFKELKRKSQEGSDEIAPTIVALQAGMLNLHQNSAEKRTFQARVVNRLPNGYAVETSINGQPLRGVLLSCSADFDSDRFLLVNENKETGVNNHARSNVERRRLKSKAARNARDRQLANIGLHSKTKLGLGSPSPESHCYIETLPTEEEDLKKSPLISEQAHHMLPCQDTVSEGIADLVDEPVQ
ncbi:uncharacterized protein LOC144702137 isoform X2 [Wolffia australiana]